MSPKPIPPAYGLANHSIRSDHHGAMRHHAKGVETMNGWTNYATWNVNLWIDNDEGIYNAKRDLLRRRKRPVTGETVRCFYFNNMGGTTPDIDQMKRTKQRYGRVNYREIASHWEDERKELQQ